MKDTMGYQLHSPALRWEEGMLCGNGFMGAIIMGNVAREQIILSHEKLFAPVIGKQKPIPMVEHLPKIREILKQEKYEEAGKLIEHVFKEIHGKDKLWTSPFFPACDLNIDTKNVPIYSDYNRSLQFDDGVAKVFFSNEDINFTRKNLVSRVHKAMLVELKTEGGSADYNIALQSHPFIEEGFGQNAIFKEGSPFFLENKIIVKDNSIKYLCNYKDRKDGYAVLLKVVHCDGQISMEEQELSLKSVTRALIAVSVVPINNLDEFDETSEWNRLSQLPNEFITASEENQLSHKERINRINVHVEDEIHWDNDRKLWMNASRSKKASSTFIEKIFNAGRYEILSSCGTMPPNLQGVWAGSYNVGWSSDYTQNGNLPTAVMGLLPCGDFESLLSYFDYQESLIEDYRENSKRLYGCRGIHIPSRTSDYGYDIHFDAQWPMLYWTAGAGWAARFYYDYWLYTGDDSFFRERALPFMKEVALFYEDFMMEDESGHWLFSPSYSPENTPSNSIASACINATMDISVAKEVFTNLIVGCSALGVETEAIARWKKILDKMPAYSINEEGALKEWATDLLEDNYDHRHISHLYMLFHDIPMEIKNDKELLNACIKAYQIKMERKKKEQGTMAFGLAQAGMVAAHLQDSSMVETMLQSMACNNYYPTYASAHDFGPNIFNADISGGVPALILEAIAQSFPVTDEKYQIQEYDIRLLPAIPESMKSGSVTGLRLRGGFILDMQWNEGKVIKSEIKNPLNKQYKISK